MELAAKTWYLADTSVEAYSIANNGALLTEQVGAWNLVTTDTVLQAPISTATQTYEAITQSFTSMYDSVVTTFGGDVTSELGAVSSFLTDIQQQAIQEMSVWVMDNFGVQAGEALFSYSTQPTADAAGNMISEGTATGMSDMLASIINVVGIIYAIYQIAKMVVQLIFACTQDEAKLNMLKEQKLCTYAGEIGSYCSANTIFGCVARKEAYCCFSSPFARIFQQQARPQLGMSFGDPKNPSCNGLSINQIGTLNFNEMDFSEWINMMKISGGLPIDNATANSMYSVGTVTASPMTGTSGPNAQSTLNSQTQGSNIDAIRQSIVNGM
jgi:conjugal transfer mating pair stabilization protein TraN